MSVRPTYSPAARRAFRAGHWQEGTRVLPEEVPVALSYNGTTQAVMMATPADLEDFARGFTHTEGLAAPGEIAEIAAVDLGEGIDLQIWLEDGAGARLAERRRTMAGPVGCGLCGLDSIEAALAAVPSVEDASLTLSCGQITGAMASLPAGQSLHDATRAAHAAGFWTPEAGLVLLREDVGRHNALDKLAGAMLRARIAPATGAVLLTSRVSIDMVQKAARLGAPVIIAASAPTAQAVQIAGHAGLTLVALARGESFEVFTRPDRITTSEAADAA